jgi:ATP-binding cassette subfamily B protein
VQEGLGGIRDILIDNNQSIYCQIYRDADLSLRRAQGNTMFLSLSPRYVVEALGMTLIAVLAFFLVKGADGILVAIPVLGAMALAAQRLLPALQQVYSSWASIRSSQASLQDVLELLDQTMPASAYQVDIDLLPFKENLRLKQVSFRYKEETPYVLKNINLNIRKGSKVGFVGVTGSGKSTLIDVLMGLLRPTEGLLEIDGQSITSDNNNHAWQGHIAHVPQVIFLADSSVEENIAFGVPKDQIDHQLVRKVAQQAQISESIESWPDQYGTFVGERGVRLSGGQRQRIGIARALYKQADVIIFDEATSALDNDTEQAVMRSIAEHGDSLTLLIIAHRLTTLSICSEIFELRCGEIIRAGTYEDIMTCSGDTLGK